MTDRYIYHRDEFENDCIFFISEDLYEARTEKRLSLREVSYATGVPLEQIDLLECCPKEIDFRIIVKLLDFYQIRLNLGRDFFPDLPQDCLKKYFQPYRRLPMPPFFPGRSRYSLGCAPPGTPLTKKPPAEKSARGVSVIVTRQCQI